MEYQRYIDLGFERTDMSCGVEYKQTGYYGFSLSKNINKKMLICVSSGELNNPKLYIKKVYSETYHIIKITPEIVEDLLAKKVQSSYLLA